MLNGGTLNYFAVPWGVIGNPLPLVAVTAVEVVLLGAVETYRCGLGSQGVKCACTRGSADVLKIGVVC